MHDKTPVSEKPSEVLPSNKLHVYDELGNAAVLGGNAMASSEPFGSVIGAVTGMVEEAVSMLNKEDSGGVKRNIRAKKLKLITNTTENGAAL